MFLSVICAEPEKTDLARCFKAGDNPPRSRAVECSNRRPRSLESLASLHVIGEAALREKHQFKRAILARKPDDAHCRVRVVRVAVGDEFIAVAYAVQVGIVGWPDNAGPAVPPPPALAHAVPTGL